MALRSASCALFLLAAVACDDADAPRPVRELEAPPPAGAPLRPLSTRDAPARDTRPVATRPLPPEDPDPAEPAITDVARLARYVFREMRVARGACPFVNPLHDRLAFAFHVEVTGGHMREVHLAWAAVHADGEPEPLETPPPELTAYADCLAPRLEAMRMSPAPADGAYQPEYSYPGHRPAS